MKGTTEVKEWTLVVKPRTGWFDINLKELWSYRDLVFLFVKRDFVAVYKQTILGPFWHLIRPLLTTLTFVLVFGRIAGLPTDGIPQVLFYMSGIVSWSYFSECLNKTADTFIANSNIFGKVYFPRLVIPLSIVISNLVSFSIQLLLFVLFVAGYMWADANVHPNMHILLLPVLVIIMGALGLGFGIIVTSLTTKYRDLKFLVTFGVQLLMYASPIIYPLSTVEGKLRMLVLLNPMSSIIETFKYAFLGTGVFNWMYLGYSAVFAFTVLLIGILIFNRVEKTFMDTV